MTFATRFSILILTLLAGPGCLHSPTVEPVLPQSNPEFAGRAEASAAPTTEPIRQSPALRSLTTAQELEKVGKFADAITFYEKARSDEPLLNSQASRRLAVLYDRTGESEKAKREFRQLLRAQPADPDLFNDVGFSHYNRGEWAEAETHFRQALDLDRSHRRARVNLGLALAQQGRHAESLSAFETALSPAEAKANLAYVLATHGRRDAATELYRQALAVDATLTSARTALAALEQPVPRSD